VCVFTTVACYAEGRVDLSEDSNFAGYVLENLPLAAKYPESQRRVGNLVSWFPLQADQLLAEAG